MPQSRYNWHAGKDWLPSRALGLGAESLDSQVNGTCKL